MKKKSGFTKKNEFRKNNSHKGMGHPAYIYAKEGNNYRYLGITHSSITKGTKNIKLEDNPNPSDIRTAYVRPKYEKANTKKFGKILPGWKFSKRDNNKIRKYKK